jgi:hypothetical protein
MANTGVRHLNLGTYHDWVTCEVDKIRPAISLNEGGSSILPVTYDFAEGSLDDKAPRFLINFLVLEEAKSVKKFFTLDKSYDVTQERHAVRFRTQNVSRLPSGKTCVCVDEEEDWLWSFGGDFTFCRFADEKVPGVTVTNQDIMDAVKRNDPKAAFMSVIIFLHLSSKYNNILLFCRNEERSNLPIHLLQRRYIVCAAYVLILPQALGIGKSSLQCLINHQSREGFCLLLRSICITLQACPQ